MMSIEDLVSEISEFRYSETDSDRVLETHTDTINIERGDFTSFINQFWTSRQRKGSSLHEISYRACFKPQLPRFFIERLTKKGGRVYDPFSGRGTTPLEAGLLGRSIVMNDINPLSKVLTLPRLDPPQLDEIEVRLDEIDLSDEDRADIDLSMFYHLKTESQIMGLRTYLIERYGEGSNDNVDDWIRMVATNRLTGHSRGFFSVYTLPPNQAVTPDRQVLINKKRDQIPDPRKVKDLILKKSRSLLRNLDNDQRNRLRSVKDSALALSKDASMTTEIEGDSIDLTVTSPPFLNIVQYSRDNWLRCWFNGLDATEIEKEMTLPASLREWENKMGEVFSELHRITSEGGWVAFEVGEVRNGNIRLEESVIPLGLDAGFDCAGVLINSHRFTKTSNIWGVSNNEIGTNSNRVVLFRK